MSKKTLLIALLVLVNFVTKAQNKNTEAYLPMAVENAQWLVYATEYDFLPPFKDYYFGYYIKGDTLINSVSYKKVYYRAYSQRPQNEGPETLPLTIFGDFLFGAIRDDIPNKKVYGIQFCDFEYQNQLFQCPCDSEFLMYDFSMEVGDLYTNQCIVLNYEFDVLGAIQTGFVFGQNRDIQFIEPIFDPNIYEGIGSSTGLFNVATSEALECYEDPVCLELVHYCIGTDQECLSDFVTLNLEENNLDNLISIYPNPVTNELTITNKFNINIKLIKIYDILGKELIETNNDKISFSNLKKGIYIIRIITKKGKSLTKKIIKS